jgi:preprotein translocase subunit SecD
MKWLIGLNSLSSIDQVKPSHDAASENTRALIHLDYQRDHMKQTKWHVLLALVGGLGLALTACNLSDLFDSQFAVSAPEIPATLQPKVVKTIPDTRVTLQAEDCPTDADVSLMNKTQQIVQQRLIGLGVPNVSVEVQDACHLTIELAAPDHVEQLFDTVVQTGRLEIVDASSDYYPEGTILRTTGNSTPTVSDPALLPDKIYATIVTGADFLPGELKVVLGGADSQQPEVTFKLEQTAAKKFAEFTTTHNETTLGKQYFLCIVLDNQVETCPSIRAPLPDGEGVITVGQGGIDEANHLLNLLRFGSLPYKLEVIQSESK